jgi:putative ABC transport system permease protein
MLSEWLSNARIRLRAVFKRAAVEQELDDELRFHLEHRADTYIREGVPPAEAMRRARIALGGLDRIKDDARDERGVRPLEILVQDFRYAVRGLRAKPGFTAAVVLTLALGFGANAAMFGIVDRLMFRPAPYLRDPASVHRVYLRWDDRGADRTTSILEYTRYLDLTRWTESFSQVAGFAANDLAIGIGQDAREMPVGTVSASYFGFFNARPALGRFFTAREDTVPIGAMVAVLSYPLWQSRFGGRADVIGQPLQVGTMLCTIIGVAPRSFVGTLGDSPPAVWVPITAYAGTEPLFIKRPTDYYTRYTWGWMGMLVRRKPGVTVEQVSTDLSTAYRRSWTAARELEPGAPSAEVARARAVAAPLQAQRGPDGGRDAQIVVWISGVALIVLLIACANVANLLLARALRRRREIALRLALGVSRGRLVSQLLTEAVVLASLGGAAGLLVGQWGGSMLRSLFLAPAAELSIVGDTRTLVFAALMVLVVGVLTGLAPLIHAGRDDLATTLKAGAREGTYHRSRTRTALLVMQGTLSVVLLVGAGLFVRSLLHVRAMPLGYTPDRVLFVWRQWRGTKVSRSDSLTLGPRLVEEARSIPGVEGATTALTVPFWRTISTDLFVPGIDSVRRLGRFVLQAGSPDYFRTVGTRILRGRGLLATDRAGGPLVAVVSEKMARTLWPGTDAIGKCMHVEADTLPCTTVVGIAENIHQNSLTEDTGLQYYLASDQFHPEDVEAVLVRVRGDAASYVAPVRDRLQRMMPGASYVTVTPFSDRIGEQVKSWQQGATMFLAFGALALVLAAIGLYSVIAYNVAQRSHELGVRIALGARIADVLRLIVGQGLRFAVAGVALGGAIALAAGQWIAPLLFEESPRDPIVFASVAAMLLAVAIAATFVPALRAARVDPTVALRSE